MPATIELDLVGDVEVAKHTHTDDEARPLIEADTRRWLDEGGFADVTFVIKQVFGPGGGASVIDFTAPTPERLRALVERYDAGNGDVAFLLEGAVLHDA